MNISARTYLASGIATVGAGAIALTPVQPLPALAPLESAPAVKNMAVALASTIDPITPWVDTFKTAAANIKTLAEFYLQQPFPLIQTYAKNQVTYFNALPDVGFIGQSIANNTKNFFLAPWWNEMDNPILNGTLASQYISDTQTAKGTKLNALSQQEIYNLTAPILAPDPGMLQSVIEFTATPYSSQIVGLIGPILGQLVTLTRSFTAVGEFWQAGDLAGAINELINIPANLTNAALNGAGVLDATQLMKNLNPDLAPLIRSFGVNLGGILSPPVPFDGSLVDPDKPAPSIYTGGTMFDAVQTKLFGGNETTGFSVGPVSAVIGLGQFLGDNLLVTPPPAPTTALAPAAATPAVPAMPATPAVPATRGTPAVPAVPATPAVPAVPDFDETPAPVETPAPKSGRDTSAAGSDNAGNGGGHSRAARSGRG